MKIVVFSKEAEAEAKAIEGGQSDSEDRGIVEGEVVEIGRDNRELQVLRTPETAKVMHLHKAFEMGMASVCIQKENRDLEAGQKEIMAVGTALVVLMWVVVHKASQMGMGLVCIQRENRELLTQKQVDNEHILH